jgi:hypothetical protein
VSTANETPEQAFARRSATATEFYNNSVAQATRYTTVLIAAGFAAFFTVWNGFRPLLPTWVILLTGSLIGAALILFIAYEIYKAAVSSNLNSQMANALLGADATTFDTIMSTLSSMGNREGLRQARIWPWIFYPNVALGIGAAVLLVVFGLLGSTGLLKPEPSGPMRSCATIVASHASLHPSEPAGSPALSPSTGRNVEVTPEGQKSSRP